MSACDVVSRRFAEYLERSEPLSTAVAFAVERTKGIHAALSRSVDVVRAVRVGSQYKRTAIHGASDLDLFVVIRRDEVRRAGSYVASTTVLGNFREAIGDRYPRSAVGRDRSAVVVSFSSGPPIDVVPAVYSGPLADGNPLFLIPDGDGGWQETSPDSQRAAFVAADARSRGKLRGATRIIKAWARYRDAQLPLSSFYVESVLSVSQVAEGVRPYSLVVADAYDVLAQRGEQALQDPLGISGYIRPARTSAQREGLAASFSFASDHSNAAAEAEQAGDSREAVRQWRIVLPGFRGV